MIDRAQFVEICTQAIISTRNKVTIRNQKSGYLKFHQAIKEGDYFSKLRAIDKKYWKKHGYSPLFTQQLVKHGKMGNCHELADYLCVKIIRSLQKYDANATVKVVSSKEYDHVYLRITILLKNEVIQSSWEVDAWNPRIIDVTKHIRVKVVTSPLTHHGIKKHEQRLFCKTKNNDLLEYGDNPSTLYSTTALNFPKKTSDQFVFDIPEPKEGAPSGNATPPREVLDKHNYMYDDYTLEEAYKNGALNENGEIGPIQKASYWQIK